MEPPGRDVTTPRGPRRPAYLRHALLDLGYVGAAVLGLPIALARLAVDAKARARAGPFVRDLPARMARRTPREGEAPCVLVQAVSVGEVKAVARLLARLAEELPGADIVLGVTTVTGRRVAAELYPTLRVERAPTDLSWSIHRYLAALRPDLVLLVESGLWPGFLLAARRRGVPVVLVNGRMSERSARRFGRTRWFARRLFGSLDRVFAQLAVYAERLEHLGVDPDRIVVTGNLKLDNVTPAADRERVGALARLFGLQDTEVPVLVAGSTHPGEERELVRVVRQLAAGGRRMHLVLVPRHPERRDSVAVDVRREGGAPVLRSGLLAPRGAPAPDDVFVLDTVGELEHAYGLAAFAFVGGTLVPHGGQNLIEPASLGLPVVVGPHLFQFRSEVALLRASEGVRVVDDAAGLEAVLRAWHDDRAAARALGARARDAVCSSQGASERTIEGLRPHLARLSPSRVSARAE
ncbi:MAG: 3-deoxy-D-manno-octulosonic acid transferase [Planctomycetota bacterium]